MRKEIRKRRNEGDNRRGKTKIWIFYYQIQVQSTSGRTLGNSNQRQ